MTTSFDDKEWSDFLARAGFAGIADKEPAPVQPQVVTHAEPDINQQRACRAARIEARQAREEARKLQRERFIQLAVQHIFDLNQPPDLRVPASSNDN